ncbi:MAG: phosphoadenosine phosphosulfate reductase [Planctomycetota bacterium]|jgi:hypothetical protein|nr:phosphoadenosine phosphosulfate reductase [Planctomycetota bacterium]
MSALARQETFLQSALIGQPLVVSYGMGVDSTALLVMLEWQGIRPDAIVFADTGSEKPETYAYATVIEPWLQRVGFPALTIVKNPSPIAGHASLIENCLDNRTLPSLAFGRHSCSLKWKVSPNDAWVSSQDWARAARSADAQVLRLIGYDASAPDLRRRNKALRVTDPAGPYAFSYPLCESQITRDRCKEIILGAGLPVPVKSACTICPASHKEEVLWLAQHHPDLLAEALRVENLATHNLRSTRGLGRKWSWREYLEAEAPDLLRQVRADYDTAQHMPAAYASGAEVWIPKRQRHDHTATMRLTAA